MKKLSFLLIISITLLFSCQKKEFDPVRFVDPFIGTGGHGHTYPGATLPFGMVQLSPDTRLSGWDGCSGYHYSDTMVYGFSHTHLSGTGCSDYGDILLMPMHKLISFKNTEYASHFSHDKEFASPGYYRVFLDDYGTLVELTTTRRAGFHRYSFPSNWENYVMLDLRHRDRVLDSYLKIINDSTVTGWRISSAWAREQHVYFYIRFSQPFDSVLINDSIKAGPGFELRSTNIAAIFPFSRIKDSHLLVKVGISAVDTTGARLNLEAEIPSWNFDSVRMAADSVWRHELSKIIAEDKDTNKLKIFYTALYHTLVVPNLFSDVDGRYRGMDMKIHKTDGKHEQYTVFSLWDTYRATHPLYTLIEQKRTTDFIRTFYNQYNQGGRLPIWELAANYTNCMIGYHAVPVIADAYLKGLTDLNGDVLLKMMLTSADADGPGLNAYRSQGYIGSSNESQSVSKTLEYSFDDWAIAQVAKKVGDSAVYRRFIQRAQYYKNLFDPITGFMRPKLNQTWKDPFDPREVDFNFTEANSWQYTFHVMQDVYGLMELMGGRKGFEKKLDGLFTAPEQTTGREQADITGLIGQYAHGNEPSHHIAYLYMYAYNPWKTEDLVQQIADSFYRATPDGLIGNEDCGQMSAWYVLSAMGFYPVNPVGGEFVFGKPLLKKITINLENGKQFVITASGPIRKDTYIQHIYLNNKPYKRGYITYQDIIKGGKLHYSLGIQKRYFYRIDRLPHSSITDHKIVINPALDGAKRIFRDSTLISVTTTEPEQVFIQIDSNKPFRYTTPFYLDTTTAMRLWAERDGKMSKVLTAKFYKIPKDKKIIRLTQWHHQYPASGHDALIDGIRGGQDFSSGDWQGYYYDDLVAIVDLGKRHNVTEVGVGFYQNARSWIWLPQYVDYWVGSDTMNMTYVGRVKNTIPQDSMGVVIKDFIIRFYPKDDVRYIKILAKNHLICPPWHPGAGDKAFIFADEIWFK